MRWLWYSFLALFSLGMLGLVVGIAGIVYAVSYFGRDLPDYTALKKYEPPVVTRLYAGDGRILAVYYFNLFGRYFLGHTTWKP